MDHENDISTNTGNTNITVVDGDAVRVITPPAWLRAKAQGNGNTTTMTYPAEADAVFKDDMHRFRDPAKGKNRMLVRVTVREGQGLLMVPGGHLVAGGVNAPIALWPAELEALREHFLTTPETEEKHKAAKRAYDLEIAKELRKKLIAHDPIWNQATAKDVAQMIADDSGDVGFKLLVKDVLETTGTSVQGCFYAMNDEPSRPVLAIEVLEQSLPIPAYAPEAQRAAQADAMAAGIERALAPALARLAEASSPSKGGK
jgi:hypothetical protein